jgi:signal transduction histidine kinase
MSHEIRTPINAMIGYAELIELGISGPVTDDQRRQLERIRASGQHLIALISEILDFARIESSQITVQREVALAADAVEASLSLVRPQAELKGISLSSGGENGVVRYVGDPQRVRQILVNLLTNAVKFTKSGGSIHVTYGTRPTSAHALGTLVPPAGWTCFTVRDNGIGISPNQLEAIFEPFIQGESGYTRRQGGSGLGLSISLSLAHLMHGDVSVASVPGSGSSFTLWLPAAEVYDAKGAPAAVARR